MPLSQGQQIIRQLEKRKGGYYYLRVAADLVDTWEKKRATRLVCTLDETVSYSCGLNHMGDGDFFVIIAGRHLKKLDKDLGDPLDYQLDLDPNPLGVPVPEVLTVLLAQDTEAEASYEQLTDGKKRSLIHRIKPIKDLDLQVQTILNILQEEEVKRARKANKKR